jgi:hypothetical protein
VTWRRRIGGAGDAGDVNGPRCPHADLLHLRAHGTYSETCAERDAFAAEFPDRLVSRVTRSQSGVWEWTFCPECARRP